MQPLSNPSILPHRPTWPLAGNCPAGAAWAAARPRDPRPWRGRHGAADRPAAPATTATHAPTLHR